VEGKNAERSLLNSRSNNIINLSTTELPILSVKNRIVHQGALNRVAIKPEFVALATEASKPIIFRIRLNPTLTGTPSFADVNAATSVVAVDTDASGVSGGRVLLTTVLGKEDSELINFHELDKQVEPGEVFVITAEATSGPNQEVTVSLTWDELF
jgi:hypothetical protein